MVRSLVMGFGAATLLAAAGSMTPAGQALLGGNHPAAAPAPAAVVQYATPPAKHAVSAKTSTQARPTARRAAVASRAAAAPRRAAPAPATPSLNAGQFLPILLQSQSLPSSASQTTSGASPFAGILTGGSSGTSPLAGILGGGSSLPGLLQQATNQAPAPAQAAAPQFVPASAQDAPAPSKSGKAIREE